MIADDCMTTGTDIKDTGFGYTLSLIGGKYKMIIMYWLSEKKVVRHNELKRLVGSISFKMLSVTLKELEANDLIIRKEYPQVPPKVEYALSERGKSLIPILDALYIWGEENRPPKTEVPLKKGLEIRVVSDGKQEVHALGLKNPL